MAAEGLLREVVCFLISFLSSVAGAICGIGGGVVIKPVLDLFQVASVSAVSFLSGCTVLSMSLYSAGRSMLGKEQPRQLRSVIPLAIGAALGGLAGKFVFSLLTQAAPGDTIGKVQAACLAIITLAALVYTLNKHRIPTMNVRSPLASVVIGLGLGILSGFLGIGGGPINLVVLYFFFSMDTKTAASGSLFIILFSQIASLAFTLLSGNVPSFRVTTLLLMILGGIAGGVIGRGINKHISAKVVDKLFVGLIVLIVCISLFNLVR